MRSVFYQRIIFWLLPVSMFIVGGCGDFFTQKPTELQTEQIFRELSEIKIIPDVDRPLPADYTAAPKIIPEKDGVKLFYFTRHHRPDVLAELITEQLGYQVSRNSATNQMIIKCPSAPKAESVLTFLNEVDVMPIQVKVDCLISEIFADVTMDYETDALITDLFGEGITLDSFLPGASLRDPARSTIGMKAGISRDEFDALIDILESRGYAKILMHPVVEVVNGTTTRIETKERVPIQEQVLSGGDIITTIKYTDVIDYLDVTPQVYADGTIGLKTSAGIGSRTIPEGVSQAPIITSRAIDSQENRLKKGQSLVIGGIRKTERTSVIRGVPFLKDIPLLGLAFSSKDFEDRAKEILFIITPSISGYGESHPQLVEQIREKHAMPEYKPTLEELFTDPFGSSAYTRQIERQIARSELELLEAKSEQPNRSKRT